MALLNGQMIREQHGSLHESQRTILQCAILQCTILQIILTVKGLARVLN